MFEEQQKISPEQCYNRKKSGLSVNNDVNNLPAMLQGVYKTKPDLNNLWDECSEKGI